MYARKSPSLNGDTAARNIEIVAALLRGSRQVNAAKVRFAQGAITSIPSSLVTASTLSFGAKSVPFRSDQKLNRFHLQKERSCRLDFRLPCGVRFSL